MSNYFEIPLGEPQQTESRADESQVCDSCDNQAEFIADNNEAGIAYSYCGTCEEKRAEKFGCAMILSEGAQCEDGICGCGGTGVY
jgi:hypothetical protein